MQKKLSFNYFLNKKEVRRRVLPVSVEETGSQEVKVEMCFKTNTLHFLRWHVVSFSADQIERAEGDEHISVCCLLLIQDGFKDTRGRGSPELVWETSTLTRTMTHGR